jgi:branched-chain amino acid transport system ATP-binding protein
VSDLITFTDVVSGYGALTILNGLSFTVRKGEITLLIGPNGAGKSTVLKTFFGLVAPRSGTITLHGRDVSRLAPADKLRQGVAFVPQGRNLFGSLSLLHNLELGGVTLPRADRAVRMEEVLDRFPALRERLYSAASSLSGGEQKQLEIARALLLRPSVLLIDEPSIGLSPIVSQAVFRLLRTLADGGTSVLMVEQNVKSALGVADRVLLLESGRLTLDTPAAKLLDDPDLNRIFLGKSASKPQPEETSC